MANKIINQENEIKNMKILHTEDTELKEKVKLLEAVVQKMFLNVINLEAELNNKKITIKDKTIIVESIGEEAECKSKEEKTVMEDGSNKKLPEVEVKKDKGKHNQDLKCEICDYSCKKTNMMKKHVNMKHGDHNCKTCDKAFPTSMDALLHTAKDHCHQIVEDNTKIDVQDLQKDNFVSMQLYGLQCTLSVDMCKDTIQVN